MLVLSTVNTHHIMYNIVCAVYISTVQYTQVQCYTQVLYNVFAQLQSHSLTVCVYAWSLLIKFSSYHNVCATDVYNVSINVYV